MKATVTVKYPSGYRFEYTMPSIQKAIKDSLFWRKAGAASTMVDTDGIKVRHYWEAK